MSTTSQSAMNSILGTAKQARDHRIGAENSARNPHKPDSTRSFPQGGILKQLPAHA